MGDGRCPYDPGSSAPPVIEARTIHSDGTVIPLVGKVSDLLVFKTRNSNYKAAVFNMPSVEVGSILEYKWTIPLTGGRVAECWKTKRPCSAACWPARLQNGRCSSRSMFIRSTSIGTLTRPL